MFEVVLILSGMFCLYTCSDNTTANLAEVAGYMLGRGKLHKTLNAHPQVRPRHLLHSFFSLHEDHTMA